ncbi:MAG: type I-C CRISPR-associated protein Cas5 [Phycisphaerae bacterium]|nr:type I-C CRISPR-associated protein Cas5 [Phycisphaerae bacterium]
MSNSESHTIEVWGEFACFSRPELSVERFSYPCPTPSAVRGIFDAIYFKPEFYWQTERVELLAAPVYMALRRNEVRDKAPAERTIQSWIRGSSEPHSIRADDPAQRQQRQTMALRAPRYRLTARIVPRKGHEHQHRAYGEQFVRRASSGKCFQQPYLGCREFVAFFRYVDHKDNKPSPVDWSQDLGLMLYDVFDLAHVNTSNAKPYITLFKAVLDHGVLNVPPYESEVVLKPESMFGVDEGRAG